MSRAICFAAALCALSCGGVARVAAPVPGEHVELTVEEYEAAEAKFAGGELIPEPDWNAPSVARCQKLLDTRDGLMWAAGFCGAIGGGGGLEASLREDASRAERLAVGVSSAIAAAAGSAFTALAAVKSRDYEQECNTERPAAPPSPAAAEIELEQDGGP